MKSLIVLISSTMFFLFCSCQKELQEENSLQKKNNIVQIEIHSRNPLQENPYPITYFNTMWKVASYTTTINSPDTLLIIDSLINNFLNKHDSKEWHPVNLTAGMIITRANGSKDSIAFDGGLAYRGRIYTYEANRGLVYIFSKQLPYIESLLWQVLIAPNDTTLKKKLDEEMMRMLTQGDSTK